MDAQTTMRLMFDSMDAYDRADFARLGEIHAKGATWIDDPPTQWDCGSRDDIFEMFENRMGSDTHVTFDEMHSTPTKVMLTVRLPEDEDQVVHSVFKVRGRKIVHVQDFKDRDRAETALRTRREASC